MRDFLLLLFTFWLTTLFLPWWALIFPATLLGATLFTGSIRAFTIGFISGAAAWGIQVIYIDIANRSVLSSRMADMIGVGSSWIVILITMMIAGILTALYTLLGTRFRLMLNPRQNARSFS